MAKGWDGVVRETTRREHNQARAQAAREKQEARDRRRQDEVELGIRRCEVCGDYHDPIDFEGGDDPHMHDGSYY